MASRNRQSRGGNRSKQNDHFREERKKPHEVDESSEIVQVFKTFQQELDQRNDKHERIVKLSRDITIESKRLIFLLHRGTGSDNKDEIFKQAEEKLQELYQTKFLPLSSELKGQDAYQFLRAFSPGLQEFVEAVTFYYFLKNQELVGVDRILADIHSAFARVNEENKTSASTAVSESGLEQSSSVEMAVAGSLEPQEMPIPLTEYMLGIADFTGELMRVAINSVGAGDLNTPKEVTDLMRTIHNAFISFSNTPRELRRKSNVLRQSLHKVENACYNLRVRGSEIPKHMLTDVFSSAHTIPYDNFIGENEDMM